MAQRREISIEPRGKRGILFIRFTASDGSRVQRSSGTTDRRLAEELANKLWTEAFRVGRLGGKPRRTWEEAAAEFCVAHQNKRSLGKDVANIRWLDPHWGTLRLDEITANAIREVAKARAAEPAEKRREPPPGEAVKLTSPATVNRMLALIRSILRHAANLEWIDRVPAIKLLDEGEQDPRFLTREEAQALLVELPPHLAAAARFSLATGLREQNALRLPWNQVDMARRVAWVKSTEAKAKQALSVPLNEVALDVLRGQQGKHRRWCFPGEDGGSPPVRASNKSWYRAVERAGVAPLRWHDLRHTWASWHVMSGTPLEALQKLGGWRSIASVQRYAHFAPGFVGQFADRMTAGLTVAGTNSVQAPESKKAAT